MNEQCMVCGYGWNPRDCDNPDGPCGCGAWHHHRCHVESDGAGPGHRCLQFEDALPIARSTDPQTSHEAAEAISISGRRASLKAQCLAAVFSMPGHTAGEYGDLTGLGHEKVWRRLSELKREGKITEGTPREWHGRQQVTLWPATEPSEPVRYAPHACRSQLPTGVGVFGESGGGGQWWVGQGRTTIQIIHCPYCGQHLGLPKGGERAAQPYLGL